MKTLHLIMSSTADPSDLQPGDTVIWFDRPMDAGLPGYHQRFEHDIDYLGLLELIDQFERLETW